MLANEMDREALLALFLVRSNEKKMDVVRHQAEAGGRDVVSLKSVGRDELKVEKKMLVEVADFAILDREDPMDVSETLIVGLMKPGKVPALFETSVRMLVVGVRVFAHAEANNFGSGKESVKLEFVCRHGT